MRMLWLDFFRGAAALVVVVYHLHKGLWLPDVSFGYLAVDMFFVLSGIVLGIRYTASISSGLAFREFAWHRFRRLYPMAFLTAMLVMGMDLTHVPNGPYAWSINTKPAFLSMLFVTPLPQRFGEVNAFPAGGPTWSLWAELVSNVIWFIALRCGPQFTRWMFVLCLAASLAYALHVGNYDYGAHGDVVSLTMAVVRALGWFGVGYFVALKRPIIALPRWGVVGIFVATLVLFESRAINEAVAGFVVVCAGSLLLVSLMSHEPKSPLLARLCMYLGMMSFPLYLVHIPVHRIAALLTHRGWVEPVAYTMVLVVAGVVATFANEVIVRRLPSRFPFFDKKARAVAKSL